MGGRPASAASAAAASVADQGVAALTNVAVVIVAARQSTVDDFASFAVVYTVFALLLGLTGAYVGQPLALRRGRESALHRHCRASVAFTLYASGALGAVLAAATVALPGGIAGGLAALGVVLPVVLTQEALRYAFAVLRVPHLALASDVVRGAVALPLLAAQPYGTGPARMVLVWGLSALPALALAGLLLIRRTRGARGAVGARALLDPRHLGRRFAVEFGVGNAGSQVAVVGLGVLADPLAVGALRGASTLFGPMNVLFNAATGFGPPLLGRHGGPHRQARAAGLAGGVLAAVAVALALALSLLPDAAGREILGDTWELAVELLPATGSQYAAMALGTCGLLTLRLLSPRATLPLQVVFSAFSVCCLLVGYGLGGITGAAWGLAFGSAAKAAAVWARVALELRTVVRS
ncbi:hypothetical protein [Streptomyces radicis]|uniref:Lipopolysaccharide biosynthesis protein n=1 Tax=Streptomyces radicis TaxID=1750517 RepID=A0A3A9X1B9_9ACTN|nr:hypothetical protein [Streptomyces radicis]RKN12257.1 hypothetical protein D7319_04435 [Streptomyces radicis]RKN26069.1 hypothetical protein D7318_06045 [Streptomyces radicis]